MVSAFPLPFRVSFPESPVRLYAPETSCYYIIRDLTRKADGSNVTISVASATGSSKAFKLVGGTGQDSLTGGQGADGGAAGGQSDVLIVESGATATASNIKSFSAGSTTKNLGTATLNSKAGTTTTINML